MDGPYGGRGAPPNAPIHTAAAHAGDGDGIRMLVGEWGADVEGRSGGRRRTPVARPLLLATRRGHVGVMRALLEVGADPNGVTDLAGAISAGFVAASAGDLAALCLLGDAGCVFRPTYGSTALAAAAAHGHVRALEYIVLAIARERKRVMLGSGGGDARSPSLLPPLSTHTYYAIKDEAKAGGKAGKASLVFMDHPGLGLLCHLVDRFPLAKRVADAVSPSLGALCTTTRDPLNALYESTGIGPDVWLMHILPHLFAGSEQPSSPLLVAELVVGALTTRIRHLPFPFGTPEWVRFAEKRRTREREREAGFVSSRVGFMVKVLFVRCNELPEMVVDVSPLCVAPDLGGGGLCSVS